MIIEEGTLVYFFLLATLNSLWTDNTANVTIETSPVKIEIKITIIFGSMENGHMMSVMFFKMIG